MHDYTRLPETPDDLTEFYTRHLNLVSAISQQLSSVQKIVEANAPEKDTLAMRLLIRHLHITGLIVGGMLDCITISKGLGRSELFWDKLYYFRKIYLTIYETIRTFDKLNPTIREIVNRREEDAKALYQNVTKSLKKFKKEYQFEGRMSKIRNTIGGHIHYNFIEYFDQLSRFDMEEARKAVLDFAEIQKSLLLLLLGILSAPELNSIEQQNLTSNLPLEALQQLKTVLDKI